MKTNITVSPRKGEEIKTRWQVAQSRPYPNLTTRLGSLEWQGIDGLKDKYNQPAQGIPPVYSAQMMEPGSLLLRGADLGTVSVRIDLSRNGAAWPFWKVRDHSDPTKGERDFLTAQVLPHLIKFITDNRAELLSDAIADVQSAFEKSLAEFRADLDKLESMVPAMISNAGKGGN